jgi:PAS domain-containing protein
MTDISYHKDLEKKLKESDDQWQRTFDSFPDAVAIVDMNCNIIKANKILSEKIGKPIDYIIGSKCYEVIHHMTSPPTNCPHIQTMNDGLFHSEYMFEEMFGGQFLSTTSPLFGENNKVIGSVHIIHLHTIGEEK